MLLDPTDAILVHLFGLFGQHGILQVCSVETHGKPENILDGKFSAVLKLNSFKKSETQPEMEHVHLRPSHIQLVEDVFLNAGGGSGRQGHHWHLRELLTQFMQPLVVWTEIVAPLKDLRSQDDSQWMMQK